MLRDHMFRILHHQKLDKKYVRLDRYGGLGLLVSRKDQTQLDLSTFLNLEFIVGAKFENLEIFIIS